MTTYINLLIRVATILAGVVAAFGGLLVATPAFASGYGLGGVCSSPMDSNCMVEEANYESQQSAQYSYYSSPYSYNYGYGAPSYGYGYPSSSYEYGNPTCGYTTPYNYSSYPSYGYSQSTYGYQTPNCGYNYSQPYSYNNTYNNSYQYQYSYNYSNPQPVVKYVYNNYAPYNYGYGRGW